MKKLKQLLFTCKLKALNGGACPVFSKLESDYKNAYKIPHYNFDIFEGLTPEISMKIADCFSDGKSDPKCVITKAAYKQLIHEIVNQFYFIQNSDMKVNLEVYKGKGEPYANSIEMLMDLHKHHLYFLPTNCAFGIDFEIKEGSEHPMLQKVDISCEKYELVANDLFRIVHDIFGHATYGYSFGHLGEELAWLSHSKMFTPLARAALTTETRGQNSWVNFGPHMRNQQGKLLTKIDNGWLNPSDRPFAEQKVFLMPSTVRGVIISEINGIVSADEDINWDPYLAFYESANLEVCNE